MPKEFLYAGPPEHQLQSAVSAQEEGVREWSIESIRRQHCERCRIGQTLMVSSRSLDVPGGPHCDGGPTAVCVLLARTELPRMDLEVTGVTPTSWYGLTSSSVADAINDKRTYRVIGWFSGDNCSGDAKKRSS